MRGSGSWFGVEKRTTGKKTSITRNHTTRVADPRKISGLGDDLDDHISTICQPLRTLRKHERRIFKYDNFPR